MHVTPILSENSTFHLLPHQKKRGERVSDFPGLQKWPLVCLTPSELWQRVRDWKQHIWNWAINEMKETEVKNVQYLLTVQAITKELSYYQLSSVSFSRFSPPEQSHHHHNWHTAPGTHRS